MLNNISDAISIFKGLSNKKPVDILEKNKNVKTTTKIKWTEQQQNFLKSNDELIVLEALAGCGKTSSLIEYAKRRPGEKWNLIVFNKSLAEETKLLAPENLRVTTGHSLAFSVDGKDLIHKIKDEDEDVLKYWVEALSKENIDKSKTKEAYEAMNDWLKSGLDSIDEHSSVIGYSDEISKIKKKMWADSVNSQHEAFINHDVYMKLFCLRKGWFVGKWMLDEAQDWSAALWAAWNSSKPSRKIVAGDPNQSLYGWRGAVGSIGDKTFSLTESKRTPNGVFEMVNKHLSRLEAKTTWTGGASASECEKEINYYTQQVDFIREFKPDVIIGSCWKNLEKIKEELDEHGVDCYLDNTEEKEQEQKKGIIITTVFKSKGQGFDNVWVSDNFGVEMKDCDDYDRACYVALTRHKIKIRVPESWKIRTGTMAGPDIFD